MFAAAILGRENVPRRLRHLLNVESGVNDGLALPVVVVSLAIVGQQRLYVWGLIGDLAGGIGVGVALPWIIVKLEKQQFLGTAELYEPLLAFAIGMLVFAVTRRLHWNEYLAAFAAGITIATISLEVRDAFHRFGEIVAELLKLAALLLFGALVSIEVLRGTSLAGYLFIGLSLLVARPVALGIALFGSRLDWRERLAAAWFGPKGFASVVYGLLIFNSGITHGKLLFHLIACIVGLSIVVHSSTDVVTARRFKDSDKPPSRDVESMEKTEPEHLKELGES